MTQKVVVFINGFSSLGKTSLLQTIPQKFVGEKIKVVDSVFRDLKTQVEKESLLESQEELYKLYVSVLENKILPEFVENESANLLIVNRSPQDYLTYYGYYFVNEHLKKEKNYSDFHYRLKTALQRWERNKLRTYLISFLNEFYSKLENEFGLKFICVDLRFYEYRDYQEVILLDRFLSLNKGYRESFRDVPAREFVIKNYWRIPKTLKGFYKVIPYAILMWEQLAENVIESLNEKFQNNKRISLIEILNSGKVLTFHPTEVFHFRNEKVFKIIQNLLLALKMSEEEKKKKIKLREYTFSTS